VEPTPGGPQIGIDWIAFTTREPLEALLAELGAMLGGVHWVKCDQGRLGYGRAMAALDGPATAYVLHDDDREDIHVVLKGRRCRQIGAASAARICRRWAPGVRRVDVAIDVPADAAPSVRELCDLWEAARDGNFRTRARCARFIKSQDAKTGEWAHTLELGSRTSESFVRVYDKRGPLRVEVELKGDKAAAAARVIGGAIEGENARPLEPVLLGIIRGTIDFVQCGTGGGNVTRAVLADWWAAVVHGVERIRLAVAKVEDSLDKVRAWLAAQASAALVLLVRADGGAVACLDRLLAEGERRFGKRHRRLLESWEAAREAAAGGVAVVS
jgi:DNA relaxase NicK